MSSRSDSLHFDWFTFLIFLAFILVAAWILTITDWADNLALIPLISVAAVVAGSAIARSRFPPGVAIIFAAVYGLFVIGWQIGTTFDPELIWQTRVFSIIGRLGVFFRVLLSGETNNDSLIFVIFMALLFWFLGTFGGWGVFRRANAWMAILFTGFTVLIVAYYYVGVTKIDLFLAAFVFLGIILAIRVDMTHRNVEWNRINARVPSDAIYQVSRAGLFLAVILVVFAWVAPAFARSESLADAWRTVTDPFSSIRERAGDALGSLRNPVSILASEYDDELQLVGGQQPINRTVMEARPDRLPSSGGRFYWRSRVYETYQNGQWSVGEGQEIDVVPSDGEFNFNPFAGRETIGVEVAPKGAAVEVLYMPAQPTWVDRSAEIQVTLDEGDPVDVIRVVSSRYIREGETYETRASIAVPSANQLLEAGEDYPDWVLERYLEIPEEVTPRTIQLAADLTKGLGTPYEKAVAITTWLRDNIEYNRVTDSPPEGVEPLDWFLFDYRVGYCNFYASAEVIMLRSLGIPARLAAGYARGDYSAAERFYLVMGEDSHSWPEVYFPGIGWVEFEPTVSQPVIVRPEEQDEDDRTGMEGAGAGRQGEIPDETRFEELLNPEGGIASSPLYFLQRLRISQWVLLGFSAVILLGIWIRVNPTTWVTTRRLLVGGMSVVGMEAPESLKVSGIQWRTATGRIYASWSTWLKRLGLAESSAETPTERAVAFEQAYPEISADAWSIVNSYTEERFGGKKADVKQVRSAWRGLRNKLWLAWAWNLTERWRD